MVCRYGRRRWRRRRCAVITALASCEYVHGSFVVNSLADECRRRIGENAPSWSHRVASSSSLPPNMWPPMSWLHQPEPMFDAVAVKDGWNANDAHEMTVSPLNPTGYRWLPGPA